jgi:hypothetical protein
MQNVSQPLAGTSVVKPQPLRNNTDLRPVVENAIETSAQDVEKKVPQPDMLPKPTVMLQEPTTSIEPVIMGENPPVFTAPVCIDLPIDSIDVLVVQTTENVNISDCPKPEIKPDIMERILSCGRTILPVHFDLLPKVRDGYLSAAEALHLIQNHKHYQACLELCKRWHKIATDQGAEESIAKAAQIIGFAEQARTALQDIVDDAEVEDSPNSGMSPPHPQKPHSAPCRSESEHVGDKATEQPSRGADETAEQESDSEEEEKRKFYEWWARGRPGIIEPMGEGKSRNGL